MLDHDSRCFCRVSVSRCVDWISISARSKSAWSISVRKRLGVVKTVGPRPPRAIVAGYVSVSSFIARVIAT